MIAAERGRAHAETVTGEDAALHRLLSDRLYVSTAIAGVLCLLAAVAWLDVRLLVALPISVLALRHLFRRGTLERFPENRDDELFY